MKKLLLFKLHFSHILVAAMLAFLLATLMSSGLYILAFKIMGVTDGGFLSSKQILLPIVWVLLTILISSLIGYINKFSKNTKKRMGKIGLILFSVMVCCLIVATDYKLFLISPLNTQELNSVVSNSNFLQITKTNLLKLDFDNDKLDESLGIAFMLNSKLDKKIPILVELKLLEHNLSESREINNDRFVALVHPGENVCKSVFKLKNFEKVTDWVSEDSNSSLKISIYDYHTGKSLAQWQEIINLSNEYLYSTNGLNFKDKWKCSPQF